MKAHRSAGIVPVKKVNDQWYFLLLRVYKYWDFPKGEVEDGEDPLDGAIRELEEETTIKKIRFNWGKTFRETAPYAKGKIARYYLAEVIDPCEIKFLPNPITGLVEHHAYEWVTYDQGVKLLVPRVQAILKWADGLIEGRRAEAQ